MKRRQKQRSAGSAPSPVGVLAAIKGRPWELCAYRLQQVAPAIVPAPVRRDWMNETFEHFAMRCLPMMIANQSGWFILNTRAVRLTWNGGSNAADLTIEYEDERPADPPTVSYFGHGIATWRIPLLFRTPANFNLWVRGPANLPKSGAFALEGIVETDWSVATFTMNWQLLDPGRAVTFAVDDPICMVVPQRKTDLEQFSAVSRPITANPQLAHLNHAWAQDRARFMTERGESEWQKDYVRGRDGDRVVARTHATRVNVRPFREESR